MSKAIKQLTFLLARRLTYDWWVLPKDLFFPTDVLTSQFNINRCASRSYAACINTMRMIITRLKKMPFFIIKNTNRALLFSNFRCYLKFLLQWTMPSFTPTALKAFDITLIFWAILHYLFMFTSSHLGTT